MKICFKIEKFKNLKKSVLLLDIILLLFTTYVKMLIMYFYF